MMWRRRVDRGGFSDATKAAVAVPFGGRAWCKIHSADEVDHIEARANGGGNSVFNGMWICGVCNRKKSARELEDWIDYVSEEQGITDIEVWLQCRDKNEYQVEIGRKLRKVIGWREGEPPNIEEMERAVRPRPNPKDAPNFPMLLEDHYSSHKIIRYFLFGGNRDGVCCD
jgi:HNH endonuclease